MVEENIGVNVNFKEKGADQLDKKVTALGKNIYRLRYEVKKQEKTSEKSIKLAKEKVKAEKETGSAMRDTYRMYLPLLFVSQKLSEATKSLLQPSMDMLGVQELWNTMLAMAFLPTAEDTLEGILQFGEALNNLSEAERKTIGDQLLFAQVMAQGAEAGSSLAMMLAGTVGEAFAWVGAIGGAALAGTAFENSTLRAITAVSGLEAQLILTTSVSAEATKNLYKTNDAAEILADTEILLMIHTDSTEFDEFKKKLDAAKTEEQKMEITVDYIEKNKPEWLVGKNIIGADSGIQIRPDPIANFLSGAYAYINSVLQSIGSGMDIFLGGSGHKDDFISRPGQSPVSFSPNDTVVGFKGGSSGGIGNNIAVNINVSASVSSNLDMDELAKRIGDTVIRELESSMVR